ncbi:MAG: hypothetical protein A2Y40_06095 [Candidatus Margulisbacteria bacterium GWF2_35_9]|nr:MAG: hypothetical protein A2Y40_06095 [Candidatus Margulisbacteria bacterium GWF2_35_9]
MIEISDLEAIFKKIEIDFKDAPKLYISHELKNYSNIDDKAFRVLVAAVISLRTKEKTTWEVSERVFNSVKNFKDLNNIPVEELQSLLVPAGFYKRKALQLKTIAAVCLSDYQGKVPETIDELLKLNGVGRKVANLVVTEVFDTDGICVDIHVHRICNRWGLVVSKNPNETELILRDILPKKYWRIINQRLVIFGQNFCLPINPKCNNCFLNHKCAYAVDKGFMSS